MEKFAFVKSLNSKDKWVLGLGLLLIVWGFCLSALLDLSYDETYYWIYSQYLSWGYFDHPPAVAWSIFLGTKLFGNTEVGVRFVSQVLLLGTVFIILKMINIKKYLSSTTLLIFSMPLIALTGMVALPDAPLMFFSTLFFYFTKKYLEEDILKNTIFLAVTISLMFYSKYHGLLIVLLTVLAHISFLKRKSFWLVVALVVLFYLPHMYWQYQNDFVSFKFHLFGRNEKHFDIMNILDYLGGQFLLMGGLLFPLFLFIWKKESKKSPFEKILMVNSFGFLAFLFLMSFRNQIEANWTISCSIALVILMAPYVEKYKKYFFISAGVNILLSIILKSVLLVPETFVVEKVQNRLNEISGWGDRVEQVTKLCGGLKIVGDNYQFSSRMAFALNQPEIPSLHFGSRESHYKILNLEKKIGKNDKICYLTSKKDVMESVEVYTGYRNSIYVIKDKTLAEIAEYYGTTYEEIIRE